MNYLNIFTDFLSVILEMLVCLGFFRLVYKKRAISDKTVAIFSLLYVIALFCVTYFVNNANLLVLINLGTIFLFSFIYESKIVQRLIYSVVLILIFLLAEVIAGLFMSVISSQTVADYSENALYYFAGVVSSKLLTFVGIKIVSLYKKSSNQKLSPLWLFPFSALPVATLTVVFVLTDYMYNQIDTRIIITDLTASLLLVISNVAFFYLFERQLKQQENEMHARLVNQQISNQVEYLKNLTAQQKLSNRALHDVKHQMFVIRDMVKKGDPNVYSELDKIYENIMLGQPVVNI